MISILNVTRTTEHGRQVLITGANGQLGLTLQDVLLVRT